MTPRSAQTICAAWKRGRKVLVVLGAGASRSAGAPLMPDVYSSLAERVSFLKAFSEAKAAAATAAKDGSATDRDPKLAKCDERWQDELAKALPEPLGDTSIRLVGTLELQLLSLKSGEGSRAVASMALGHLQNAHRHVGNDDPLSHALSVLWQGFARDFLDNRIAGKKQPVAEGPPVPIPRLRPKPIHQLAAEWIRSGKAIVVSLNFDGLTYRALNELLEGPGGGGAAGVVVSDPADLERFYLGGEPLRPGTATKPALHPVIKVWGDVFHAACANSRCPEFDRPVAIYRIQDKKSRDADAEWLLCPNCRGARQLQIHFTGYEKKEQLTQDLMRVLYRFVSPEVGAIACVGFSGLWDNSLVEYLATMGRDVQREPAASPPGDVPEPTGCPVIVVDPASDSFLAQNLSDLGVDVIPEFVGADDFAAVARMLVDPLAESTGAPPGRYDQKGFKDDSLWDAELRKRTLEGEGDPEIKQMRPGSYEFLAQGTGEYLAEFGRLRQLGIKTRASLCRTGQTAKEICTDEKTHNRRDHSIGASHLAIYWFRQLLKSARQTPVGARFTDRHVEYLASIVFYSALHHDIGHVPFTHLTEEIFAEVRWTLRDWAEQFHHDEPVLTDLAEIFSSDFDRLTAHLQQQFSTPRETIVSHMETFIQGRSGYPWVDAILNSPLDVDKIDYIYRDCKRLRQGLHLKQADLKESFSSVARLFNGTFVLPSGQVALVGEAGEYAKHLLEERGWLYRNQYFSVGFRVLERLAGVVVLQWLMRATGKEIVAELKPDTVISYNDGSAIKGRKARNLLWSRLRAVTAEEVRYSKAILATDDYGECELLLALVRELQHSKEVFGFPYHEKALAWFRRAENVFVACLHPERPLEETERDVTSFLRESVKVTVSERFYLRHGDFERARRIAREIETTHYFTAFFDFAITPRALSYPSRRRFTHVSRPVVSECFAVSHRDPDRWGRATDRWIGLSESAFAERDRDRYVKVMALSPYDADPHVRYFIDAFRARCAAAGISVVDKDPEL